MKKRILSVFLALTMFISAFPVETVVSLGADLDLTETYYDGSCPHHTEHTSACGYVSAGEGAPCSHKHTEDCYTLTEDCVHVHDEKCYSDGLLPNEGVTKKADACSHICTEDSGCLTLTENCTHEHDSECGYAEATEGHPCEFVCEICSSIVADWVWENNYDALLSGADCGLDDVDWVIDISRFDELDEDDVQTVLREILPSAIIAKVKTGDLIDLDITWSIDKQHSEGALCTAELPEGYTMDEGAPELTVLVRDAEAGAYDAAAQDDVVEDTPTIGSSEQPDRKNEALHFIVRHWHSKDSTEGSSFQGDSLEQSGSLQDDDSEKEKNVRYFTVVEGYIVPTSDRERRNNAEYADNYHFYLVCQDNTVIGGETHKKDDLVEIHNSGYVTDSAYVVSIDHESGEIVLSPNALKKNRSEKYAETFSAYSVTTGHDAVTENPDDTLSIGYNPYIHLAKAHAFYTKTTIDVTSGVEDDTVFGATGIVADNEHDTVWVYTYSHDDNDNHKYKEGEIVKIKLDGTDYSIDKTYGKPVKKGEEKLLDKAGLTENDVELTKVYDSSEGLHTDKSAAAHDDGRTFDIDLEAWHSKGYAEQIAMVFDASGSMAFASDAPSPIKIANDSDLWNELEDKIGYVDNNSFDKTEQTTFSKEYKLLGYYEINPNSSGTQRTWYLNSKKKKPSTSYADFNKNEDFAMAVEQSTSSSIDFTGAQPIKELEDMKFLPAIKNDDKLGTGWGYVPANYSSNDGFNLTSASDDDYGNSGFMLEVAPNDVNNFTISFTLNQKNANSCNNDIEILYIGAERSNGDDNYFHVIRSGNDIIAYVGVEEKVRISNAFTSATIHEISFVFEGDKLTTYWDGNAYAKTDITALSGNAVVFAPFKDSNVQVQYFYLDSIYLFDTALDEKKIKTLSNQFGNSLTYDQAAFLTPDELALLMDPHNTDNSKLGFAGYTFFVYDPSSGTTAYNPLSYYTNDTITPNSRKTNYSGKGWYYVNCGNWASLYSNGTAKQLYGIGSGLTFNDTINAGATTANSREGAAPDRDTIKSNTNKVYTTTAAGPVKFYIDGEGYLRCFFAGGTGNDKCYVSYVYMLKDSQYIRTEALQRAIGVFATELAEQSPASRVSAVRFSAKAEDISGAEGRLVMLDWTDNHSLATKMFSFEWGKGDVTKSEASESGLEQYDYALTGGTNTNTGLQAYIDYLMDNDNPYDVDDEKVPKFLILFTDGADTNGGYESCKNQITRLRNKGYTIFTVLLDGSTINGTEFDAAEDFLTKISGEGHFYSVGGATKKWGDAAKGMNDADILTQIFAGDILKEITKPLDNYTVKDYIDPRFDLVQETGDGSIIWHLNAKGNIQLENADGTINDPVLLDSKGLQFELTDESDDVAQHPTLYYDSTNDMYYLEWTDQIIPGSAVGAGSLAVWNAHFTIRAKEDFLGGNAILTNGNKANMNYVFYSTDQTPSSGTDKSIPEDDSDKVSKGFPRVSVNVELLDVAIGTDEMRVYLGEEIDPIQAIEALSKTVDGDYYWLDYLMRYAVEIEKAGDNLSSDDLMEIMLKQLAEDPSGWGMDIPYYYLPNVVESEEGERLPSTNQTGKWQKTDQIGVLHYRWERLDPQTGEVIDVGGYANEAGSKAGGPFKGDPYQTLDTRRIEYRLVVSYWPYPDPDAEFWKMLDEWADTTNYAYDTNEYTKAFGDPVIRAVLDDMWALLEKETVTGAVGGLSARVQSANEPKNIGSEDIIDILTKYENDKYNGNISDYLKKVSGDDKDSVSYQYLAIKEKLVEADFPEKITEQGTFNDLLEEVYRKLYEETITITIKTTDEIEQYEKLKITGGLKGLINELAEAKKDQDSQTKRVYIETELFKQRNEIDNLISQMANYIDYLRWCYGYGEPENQEESKVPVQEWLGKEYKKFSERTDANHALISDVTRTDRSGAEVRNTGGIKDAEGTPEFEYAYWDTKEAEGDPQYNKTAIGMSTIRVVRGELAFELELDMENLLYLFESGSWKDYSGDDGFVPFYIDLKRESDIEWSSPFISQLEIDISKSDLLKLTGDNRGSVTNEIKTEGGVTTLYYLEDYEYEEEYEQGQKVIRTGQRATEYPKAVYYHNNYNGTAADPGTVIFYSDPRDLDPIYDGFEINKDYARLLPIGTYSMTISLRNKELWDMFDLEMFYASDDNYKFDSWHFTRTTNEGEPNNSVESLYFPRSGRSQTAGLGQLQAPKTNLKEGSKNGELADKTKGVVFQLGTHIYEGNAYYSGDDGTIPQYTDDRAGMARVKATVIEIELPVTGGSGTSIHYLLGTALVLLGGVCLIFLNRRSKRKHI